MLKFIAILVYISFVNLCLFTLQVSSINTFNLKKKCTVSLQNGTVIGSFTNTTFHKFKVCSYTGIPYASPPVASLRFQAPQPAQKWGTLSATKLPNACVQSGTPQWGMKFSEDCLYLNVYQPLVDMKNIDSAGLPVIIWFHGGSFESGDSVTQTPYNLLAKENLILVAAHYRLGILGFFSTGDNVVPGNNGLKDQALSIRWVNENIKAFGGNPNKVTIVGISAGGASVVYQLMSPLNNGLIHGVIAQSGTALSSWAIDKTPELSSKLRAMRLGCTIASSEAMISCLRKVSWEKIVKEQAYLHTTSMRPVVEPKNVPGAFISEEPEKLLETGDIPNIPLLIGANLHEGSLMLAMMYTSYFKPQGLDKDPKYLKQNMIPDYLKFLGVNDPNRAIASTIELAYFSGVNRSSWTECMPGLVDLLSVFDFKSAIQNTAEILSRRNHKVYLYSLEHHSNYSMMSLLSGGKSGIPVQYGIAHGDELMYLSGFLNLGPRDQVFSEIITELWINFGKFGSPTPSSSKKYENWIPYNNVDEPYLKLNGTPKLQYGYRNSWRPNSFEWN